MYTQIRTSEPILYGLDMAPVIPVATLIDESGSVCQIIKDDHCYVVTLKKGDIFEPTVHLFPEVLKVLAKLPNPN